MSTTTPGREPIPPAKRRRLQQLFEHGSKAADQGNLTYAVELLSQCVNGDPANPIYTRNLLACLSRQYNSNPKNVGKLAGIKSAGAKAGVKTATVKKDWAGVIKGGIEVLKSNPWDIGTLTAMAQACEEMKLAEPQLCYLKMALDVNLKDADVNRLCGRALARMGHFDQAISCWRRVEQAKPGDQESQRAIADLAVERTISHGGYEDAQEAGDVKRKNNGDEDEDAAKTLTPEQQLAKKIQKNPSEVTLYVELAELHQRNENLEAAEQVFKQALEVSGGETSLRERLEDVQLRRQRDQLAVAERRALADPNPENQQLAKAMKIELNNLEIEIFRARTERYPQNLNHKFELGVRLKKAKQFPEAIKVFQLARADAKRKGQTMIELGECFQLIRQFPLSLQSYEGALEAIPERDVELRKEALYKAGRVALYMATQESTAANDKWIDAAEKHLNELAGLEYAYKDLPALLDKIAKLRNSG